MLDIELHGNLIEAALWFLVSLTMFVKSMRAAGDLRRTFLVLAVGFLVFGVSDLIESQTGAWWRPCWLLLLKAGCVAALAAGFARYFLGCRDPMSHSVPDAPLANHLRLSPVKNYRPLFYALWLVWAGLLTAAMIAGNRIDGHGSPAAVAARMGSSVALVIVGWIAYGLWRNLSAGRFILCIAIGMTWGAIGDFFNADLLSFIPLKDPVLGGIISFGLGHIAYIAGCASLAQRGGWTNRRVMLAAIAVWQLVGLVGWYFVSYTGSEARGLVWPALPYSLLLAGTAGLTSGLAMQEPRLAGLAVGGALFLASDLILACGLFRGSFAHQTESVWLTYGPGQMLIVFSTVVVASMWHSSAAAQMPGHSLSANRIGR